MQGATTEREKNVDKISTSEARTALGEYYAELQSHPDIKASVKASLAYIEGYVARQSDESDLLNQVAALHERTGGHLVRSQQLHVPQPIDRFTLCCGEAEPVATDEAAAAWVEKWLREVAGRM